MKLYHGSPFDLEIIEPRKGNGFEEFENLTGVFLARTFLHAALYAIGKNLGGKTKFGVSEDKLVIVGNYEVGDGYVYEVEVENPLEGCRGQYLSKCEVKPIKKTKVSPEDFQEHIVQVDSVENLFDKLGIQISKPL